MGKRWLLLHTYILCYETLGFGVSCSGNSKAGNFHHVYVLHQFISEWKGLIILPKGKMLKNCHNYTLVFQHFLFGPPLETMEKSCLNKLKFWEASRNPKRSICWKFQLSISLGRQKSPSTIQPGLKLNKPFWSRQMWWHFLTRVKHFDGECVNLVFWDYWRLIESGV